MTIDIKPFADEYAEPLSELIVRSIKSLTGTIYDEESIDILSSFYQPHHIKYYAGNDEIFAAFIDNVLAATISLYGNCVRNLFVDTDYRRKGVGTQLMEFIELPAKEKHITFLYLNSNLHTVDFYKKLGYKPVREKQEKVGNIFVKTIMMEKEL